MALDLGKVLDSVGSIQQPEMQQRRSERPERRTFLLSTLSDIVAGGQNLAREVIREPLQAMQRPEVKKEFIEKDGRRLEVDRVERKPLKETLAAAAEGILFPGDTRPYRADLRDKPVLGKVAAVAEAIPFVGGAVDASVIDPLEGTKTGAVRDVGRILAEFILPAAGAANAARAAQSGARIGTAARALAPLAKSPAALATGVAGIQEFQRRGIEDPVGSAANVAAAAAGAKLGMKVTDPFVAKGANATRQIGRALAAETAVEAASGVPAALVNTSPILERLAAGEAITDEDKQALKTELAASLISVLGGSLGGVVGGRALKAEEKARMDADAVRVQRDIDEAAKKATVQERAEALKDVDLKYKYEAAQRAGIPTETETGEVRPIEDVLADMMARNKDARPLKSGAEPIDPESPDIIDLVPEATRPVAETAEFSQSPVAGGKSRLNARLEEQSRSPEFKSWFGDWENNPAGASKVVDENGEPLVVYHGTANSGFTKFEEGKYGLFGDGFYFTDSPDVGSAYTGKGRGSSPGVYPVTLSIKNPMDMEAPANPGAWRKAFAGVDDYLEGNGRTNEDYFRAAERQMQDEGYSASEARATMREAVQDGMGHDGITHIGGKHFSKNGAKHKVYIAFDNGQIKSATGNRGTFDPARSDIRFSHSPVAGGGRRVAPKKGFEYISFSTAKRVDGVSTDGGIDRVDTLKSDYKANAGDVRVGPDGHVDVMMSVPIRDIDMDPRNDITASVVEKYKKNYTNYRPVLLQKENGRFYVDNGHHRILADKANGNKETLAWVFARFDSEPVISSASPKASSPDITRSDAPVSDPETSLAGVNIPERVARIKSQVFGDDPPVQVFLDQYLKDAAGRPAAGTFDATAREVRINPLAQQPEDAAWHEFYHAAESTQLNPVDRTKIATAFNKGSTLHKRLVQAISEDARLDEYPEAKQAILAAVQSNPKEARAYGFQYWRQGKLRANTTLGVVWERVKEFLEAVHNKLRNKGFSSGLDVFRSFEAGTLPKTKGKAMFAGVEPKNLISKFATDILTEARKPTSGRLANAAAKAAQLGLPKGWVHGLEMTHARDVMESSKSQAWLERQGILDPIRKFAKDLTPEQREELTEVVMGVRQEVEHLSPEQLEAGLKARQEIDALSQRLIDEGVPAEHMAEVIERNMGRYLARVYAIDIDPSWGKTMLRKRGPEYERAAAYFVNEARLEAAGFSERDIIVPEGLDPHDRERFIAEAFEDAHDIMTGDAQVPRTFKAERQITAKDAEGNPIKSSIEPGQELGPVLTTDALRKVNDAKNIEATQDMGDQARVRLNSLLEKRRSKTLRGKGDGSGQSRMPLQRLLRKTHIPKQLRAVYGEVKDPLAVVDKTVYDIHNMLNRNKFLKDLSTARKADGTKYFYTKEELPSDSEGVFVQMDSDGPSPHIFGALSGMWTTPDTKVAIEDGVLDSLGALMPFISATTKPFQKAQTVWSTGAQTRNVLGNSVFSAVYSNVSPFNPGNWKYYRKAWNATYDALVKGESSPLYKEMAENGVLAKQFFDVPDLKDHVKKVAREVRAMRDTDNPLAYMNKVKDKITDGVRGVDDKLSAFYIMGDQMFRAASYLKRLEKNGGDVADAVWWTNLFNPDYSQLPRAVDRLQRTPLASPFMSFWVDTMFRVNVNAMIHNPVKFGLLLSSVSAMIAGAGDMLSTDDKERWQKAKELLPDYHRDGANIAFKGKDDALTYINFDNIIPLAGHAKQLFQMDPKQFVLGGPFWDSLVTLVSGRDLEGFERYPEDASSLEKISAAGKVLMKSYTPPLLPGGRDFERIRKGVTGEAGARGNVQDLSYAMLSPTTGLRPVEVFWDVAYRGAALEATRGYSDRIATAKRVIRNPGTSAAKKREYVPQLEELLARMQSKATELREAYQAGSKIGGRQSARKVQNIQDAERSIKARISEARNLIGEARSSR